MRISLVYRDLRRLIRCDDDCLHGDVGDIHQQHALQLHRQRPARLSASRRLGSPARPRSARSRPLHERAGHDQDGLEHSELVVVVVFFRWRFGYHQLAACMVVVEQEQARADL